MATLNYAFKELSCKIVYYGCGLCGKTTNLIHIHKTVPQKFRGELVSLATEQDRTLFFDFLPLDLGEVKGFKTKFQLYTVPGQVYYNATRKLVLRGVDGLVFVADSQRDRLQENIDSLENLKQNLAEYGYHLQAGANDHDGIPWVLQYNKRDMPQVSSIEELNAALNPHGVPVLEAVAVTGGGVKDTLKSISSLVIKKLNTDSPIAGAPAEASKPKQQAAAPANDEYDAVSEEELEQEAARQEAARPKLPQPAAKPAATVAPAAAVSAPPANTPTLNVIATSTAKVRGLGLGKSQLTLANMTGGEASQYQLTGKVTFLGIFGGSWSRKLRYVGTESKMDGGQPCNFFHFKSDDGAQPELTVYVKDDFDKALYVTYIGSFGEVNLLPPGKQPLV